MRSTDSGQAAPAVTVPSPRAPERAAAAASATGLPRDESLVGAARLAEFFAPRSIAVVGASDTSGWARFVLAAAAATGYTGPLIPVHPVHQKVFGRPAARSLRELAEPVDLAFVMAPAQAVESVLEDAAAAGVRGAIVLASGYREVGGDGAAHQDRLAARAAALGITMLGPNCLGFLNAHARTAPFALTVPLPLTAGPVGIAMQSGALASVVLAFARSRAIGVSTLATLGNEAMISATDVLEYLIEDENTRAICLFLEEIGDPVRFAAAARKADRAGKPVVALKAGSSPAGSQAALAHTGSVAGNDAVVDAALRQLNVIRVSSLEDLLSTAALLGYGRPPRGRRMAVLTSSGGACDIIADRAAKEGIELPDFSPPTAEAISAHLPSFAQPRNPLDATGYFLANQRTSALTPVDHALDAAVDDPGLDFVLFSGLSLPDARMADERAAQLLEDRVGWIGQRMAGAPIPVIAVGSTCVDITEYGRELLGRNGIHLLGGMDLGVQAVGHALRWSESRERTQSRQIGAGSDGASADADAAHGTAGANGTARADGHRPRGVWGEVAARGLLGEFGVPVVPGLLANSADAAVEAARRLRFPVALRIASARIAHKSDIGGVALNVSTAAQVRSAYRRVRAAGVRTLSQAEPGAAPDPAADGEHSPASLIDGVMVSAMRSGGVELLAGVTVDPTFGPVLAVGLGGVFVEILNDVSLRVLPVDAEEVGRMLGELRGAALLRGARGSRPADMDALALIIARLGDAALSLGDALVSLEINPLWVDGDQIEALDVLVVTAAGSADSPHSPPVTATLIENGPRT
jgi:acyl-CoA synthetase (NDP forming)